MYLRSDSNCDAGVVTRVGRGIQVQGHAQSIRDAHPPPQTAPSTLNIYPYCTKLYGFGLWTWTRTVSRNTRNIVWQDISSTFNQFHMSISGPVTNIFHLKTAKYCTDLDPKKRFSLTFNVLIATISSRISSIIPVCGTFSSKGTLSKIMFA